MKKETVAILLLLLSFSTGMVLTAATSGCDAASHDSAAAEIGEVSQPILSTLKEQS